LREFHPWNKNRDCPSGDGIENVAPSNRGIDEIRDLREKVRYAPIEGKYKVYIIDEVHMLTSEAFNALLKTLEEPPSHTIFVLATTEPQKVPQTISSRCQRLDFSRIPLKLVVDHLKEIAKGEKFNIDYEALNLIARTSEGSMRDAISLLVQLVSFCGKKIAFDDVVMVLGTADEEFLFSMIEAIASSDIKSALSLVEKAVSEGRGIPQITRDLVGHIRYILLSKFEVESIIDLTKEYIARLKKDAERLSVDKLKDMIRIFSKAELDMKWHPHARLILEVAVVEAAKEFPLCVNPTPQAKVVQEKSKEQPKPKLEIKEEGLLLKVKENWNKILEDVKKKSLFGYVSLHEGIPIKAERNLVIAFKKGFSFHKERLEEQSNKEIVESTLESVLGKKMPIECIIKENIPEPSKSKQDNKNVSVDAVKNMFSGKII